MKEVRDTIYLLALSIICATEQIYAPDLSKCTFFGELSLDGTVQPINGILPMVISAYKSGFTDMFVPTENADEAAVIERCKHISRIIFESIMRPFLRHTEN